MKKDAIEKAKKEAEAAKIIAENKKKKEAIAQAKAMLHNKLEAADQK